MKPQKTRACINPGIKRCFSTFFWRKNSLITLIILEEILLKGRLPSPFKTILNLLMTSQENEVKQSINKMLKSIFSIIENMNESY